ncbi:MAG: segregation/condensation protein A [Spirochaetaceae bacterium]|nr:segregation/condensation protein A [Spirochaetaceae bacterium]
MAEAISENNESEKKGHSFITSAFEGPLDLLLFLIQKSKVNIYDIPIATITNQFLDYLHSENDLDLNSISDFYKMAADLIYIKSRMLLPVDIDFDEEYEDPRQDLVERLLEYQKFRRYTDLLASGAGTGDLFIERKKSSFMVPFEDQELFEEVNVLQLLQTYTTLLNRITPSKIFNVFEEVTVNEKLALMNELFESYDFIHIEDIIIHLDRPLHIICSFMAILEACKFKMITIEQEVPFETILIRKRDSKFSLDDTNADEIDDMYEDSIKKGLYKDHEIAETTDVDSYIIRPEKYISKLKETILKEKFVPIEKIELKKIETDKHSKVDERTEIDTEGVRDDVEWLGDYEEIDLGDDD